MGDSSINQTGTDGPFNQLRNQSASEVNMGNGAIANMPAGNSLEPQQANPPESAVQRRTEQAEDKDENDGADAETGGKRGAGRKGRGSGKTKRSAGDEGQQRRTTRRRK